MPKKGYKQTIEHKRKLSEVRKGKIGWLRGKRGYMNKGSFKEGHKIPQEWRKKISKANKGKRRSEETKRKMSEARKGENNPAKRPEVRKKISKALKGGKHYNWKGGITPYRKKMYFGKKYQKWRMAVFTRDNFTCQFCGLRSHIGLGKPIYLEAHHIESWAKYPKLRFKIDNGITLCRGCHNLIKEERPTTQNGGKTSPRHK